jgi:2'-5' RNA ligase
VAGHKLFFALRPDEEAAGRIARVVTAEHEARGLPPRLRPSHIFHITLHYFGYFDGEPDERIVALAARAASEVVRPAFDLSFGTFKSWGDERATKHPFVSCVTPSSHASSPTAWPRRRAPTSRT